MTPAHAWDFPLEGNLKRRKQNFPLEAINRRSTYLTSIFQEPSQAWNVSERDLPEQGREYSHSWNLFAAEETLSIARWYCCCSSPAPYARIHFPHWMTDSAKMSTVSWVFCPGRQAGRTGRTRWCGGGRRTRGSGSIVVYASPKQPGKRVSNDDDGAKSGESTGGQRWCAPAVCSRSLDWSEAGFRSWSSRRVGASIAIHWKERISGRECEGETAKLGTKI